MRRMRRGAARDAAHELSPRQQVVEARFLHVEPRAGHVVKLPFRRRDQGVLVAGRDLEDRSPFGEQSLVQVGVGRNAEAVVVVDALDWIKAVSETSCS